MFNVILFYYRISAQIQVLAYTNTIEKIDNH